MGTDIHLSIEVEVPHWDYLGEGEARQWHWQRLRFPYTDPFWLSELEDDPTDERALMYAYRVGDLYDGRNYTLFAALSDVRNGWGFAGVTTGDPITPSVAADRGTPDWECFGRDEAFNEDWYHSVGWLELTEIFDGTVDFDQMQYKTGIFSEKSLDDLDPEWLEYRIGNPKTIDDKGIGWSGGISGPNVKVFESHEEYLRAHDAYPLEDKYIRLGWMTDVRSNCWEFIEAMTWLRDFGLNGIPPEKCRIVIGYDS